MAKFESDWVKIENFSLIAYFQLSLIFFRPLSTSAISTSTTAKVDYYFLIWNELIFCSVPCKVIEFVTKLPVSDFY